MSKAEKLLQSIVDAYDAGCVQMSSADIQFNDGNPPHPWHEEWIADVRRTLIVENPHCSHRSIVGSGP